MKDLNDPSNRDTIPAMLTAGEFVMNKEATAMFGPQIKKMNDAGLAQRQAENEVYGGHNMGGVIQQNGYNTGGGVFDNWDMYSNTIGQIESGGKYDITGGANDHYQGKYQLGEAAKKDAAKRLGVKVPSRADFVANPELQEKFFRAYTEGNHQSLLKKNKKYAAMSPQEQQQVLGYAHNQGAGGASQWLNTGKAGKDAFGTSGTKYSEALAAGQGGQQPQQPQPQPQQQAEVAPMEAPPPTVGEEIAGQAGDMAMGQLQQMIGGGGQAPIQHQLAGREMTAPEYIPLSAQRRPDEMQVNNGGPIYLRGGGLASKAEQKRQFEERRRLLADKQARSKPMNFRDAAINATQRLVPRMNAPHQSPFVSPDNSLMQFDRSPDDIGDEIQRGWNKEDFDMGAQSQPGTVPQIPMQFNQGPQIDSSVLQQPASPGNRAGFDLPPIPGSDEALLQGSSQQVEALETAPPMVAPSGAQYNAIDTTPPAPPMPTSMPNTHPLAQGSDPHAPPAAGGGGVPEIGPRIESEFDHILPIPTGKLAGLSQEEIGVLYDQGDPDAVAYANQEDAAFNINRALQQAQLQQSVTAPDAPGAAFADARVDALTEQLSTLGTPENQGGVGLDTVPAVEEDITPYEIPGQLMNADSVGAVPGMDQNAPNPEEIISGTADWNYEPDGKQHDRDPVETAEKVNDTLKQLMEEAEQSGDETVKQEPTATEKDAAEEAGNKASPSQISDAKTKLSGLFGDLFDKKELARAAIMFVGALATGASPGRALAFAGQGYLQRLDSKASNIQALTKSGKYVPSSVQTYKESGNIADLKLVADPNPVVRTGNTKDFTIGGKQVRAVEMKAKDGNVTYVTSDGKAINLAVAKDFEPSFHKGTPEYRVRRSRATKAAAGRFEERQESDDTFKDKDGNDIHGTNIGPKQAADEFWRWAEEAGIDPESDEALQIQTNAYQTAIADAKGSDGKIKPNRLRPYLEAQMIKEQTGFPDLFTTPKGAPVNVKNMQQLTANVDAFVRMTPANIGRDQVFSITASEWNKLGVAGKKNWDNKADGKASTSGFYLFMQHNLGKLASQIQQ